MDVEPGDWVKFYRNGQFKIAQVEYIRSDHVSGYQALTHEGAINTDSILEVRGAKGAICVTPDPK